MTAPPAPPPGPVPAPGDGARRVIVTRPEAQAADWVSRLQRLGVPAAALPLLRILPPADAAPLAAAWQQRASTDLMMFVSPSAVQMAFATLALDADAVRAAWPAGLRAACVGPGTAAALVAAGVPAAAVVQPPPGAPQLDSEALWAVLRTDDWRGLRVRLVRGAGGREWLAERLAEAGARVEAVAAYDRAAPRPDADGQRLLAQALAAPAAHAWLFSSSEAAGHLPALAPGASLATSLALATHPRIADAARAIGFGTVRAVGPRAQDVADALRAGGGGAP